MNYPLGFTSEQLRTDIGTLLALIQFHCPNLPPQEFAAMKAVEQRWQEAGGEPTREEDRASGSVQGL